MIYSVIVGILLGGSNVKPQIAIPIILLLIALRGLFEIIAKKNPFTGSPSPYVLYLEKLEKNQPAGTYGWKGFLIQVILFGCLLGFIAYAISFYAV